MEKLREHLLSLMFCYRIHRAKPIILSEKTALVNEAKPFNSGVQRQPLLRFSVILRPLHGRCGFCIRQVTENVAGSHRVTLYLNLCLFRLLNSVSASAVTACDILDFNATDRLSVYLILLRLTRFILSGICVAALSLSSKGSLSLTSSSYALS